jgi:hypothetical protein
MRERILRSTVLLGILTGIAGSASGHEKWFHETRDPGLHWDLLFRPMPLGFIAAVIAVTVVAGLYWRKRGRAFVPGPENLGTTDDRRSALYGLVPAILGIHVAVPLLVAGVQGELFSPNNKLSAAWVYFLGLALTGVALSLFYGALARLTAAALAVIWMIGVFLFGIEPMLDNAMYLGFAAFFFLAGRGPVSIDRLIFPRLEPSPELMRKAVTALRVGLGASLIFVAFSEKLANLPLALAFLEKYPLNFTAALGIPMSNETFVLCAGAVELLVGLWILFGIFPREIIIIAWIPINMTLTIFNWSELIGHLPIYGTLAVLVIWSPGEENLSLWLRGLREGPLAILKQKNSN